MHAQRHYAVYVVRVRKYLIVHLSKHWNYQYRYRSIGIDVNTFSVRYLYRYRRYFYSQYRYRISAILLKSIVNNPDEIRREICVKTSHNYVLFIAMAEIYNKVQWRRHKKIYYSCDVSFMYDNRDNLWTTDNFHQDKNKWKWSLILSLFSNRKTYQSRNKDTRALLWTRSPLILSNGQHTTASTSRCPGRSI